MLFIKKYFGWLIFAILALSDFTIWQAVFWEKANETVTVSFLNVGQGDSIFIESPDHHQMIIDGGPNAAILSEMAKFLPWYDRFIDVLMVSSPDIDHYGGFIDLLNRYEIGMVIEPGTSGGSESYRVFEGLLKQKNIKKILARRGQTILIGNEVQFKILFPDRDVSKLETNTSSIIGQLIFGSTSIMFTGDAPDETEKFVALLDGGNLKSGILKVAHHGSKTSVSQEFISAVSPEFSVISAGKDNHYGHPHQETLDILNGMGSKIFITFNLGTLTFESDGKKWTPP